MMRLVMVVMLLLSIGLYGVELQRGQSYEGPMKLTAKILGVGLGISREWRASLPEQGGLQVSSNVNGIIITMRSKELTADDAMQYLNLPIEYEPGVMLFPSKRIVELTRSKLRRSFRVNGRDAEAIIYVLLGPHRRAVVMTGLSSPRERDLMQAELLSIANTVTFTPLKPLSDDRNSLKQRLIGGYFTYYETVGLGSEKRELWLCSEGRFILRAREATGGGISRELIEYRGSWTTDDIQLKLHFKDGSQKSIFLREEGNAIFFNESRSYRLTNRVCR